MLTLSTGAGLPEIRRSGGSDDVTEDEEIEGIVDSVDKWFSIRLKESH